MPSTTNDRHADDSVVVTAVDSREFAVHPEVQSKVKVSLDGVDDADGVVTAGDADVAAATTTPPYPYQSPRLNIKA